jgi:hypothetical protein
MSAAKTLALIVLGYALAIAGGYAVVAVRDLLVPDDVAQGSPGMLAFGDMILFVLAAGVLGLAPTWLLLRLALRKAPRALLGALVLIAAMGPLSWLAVIHMAGGGPPNPGQTAPEWLGLFLAFAAIPRIVAGPVLLAVEAVAIVLARSRVARGLLAAAMLMDLIPLSIFAFHVARAQSY